MTSFLQRLQASERPLVWVDATAYAGRLLANARVPWLDAAEYVAWQRKSQALLDSDVIGLPLGQIVAEWIRSHDELQTAMTTKRRITHPLRVVLGDEDLRAFAASLTRDLRATFTDTTLALMTPSPRVWVARAHTMAHGTEDAPEVDDDEAESGAVFVADFLRSFAECAVDALLLEESPALRELRLDDPSYVPVANLCSHYRWDFGLRGRIGSVSGVNADVAFVITPNAVTLANAGAIVPAEFWAEGSCSLPYRGTFCFAEIPEDADPSRVLERLASLRF